MKKSLFSIAIKIAQKELNSHPEFENYCHWSFVVVKNQIIEWATNHKGTPPINFGYNERIDGNSPKTHSEFAAFKKARGLIKDNNFELINIRLSRMGKIRNSKPCCCCYSFLSEMNCSKIYYTVNDSDKFLKISL